MNKRRISILVAIIVLVLASLACNAVTGGGNNTNTNTNSSATENPTTNSNDNSGFSFTTANIQNAHLSTDVNDSAQTTSYVPSDKTFYCFFDLKNAPESTVVKGTWTLVSAEGFSPNTEIDSAEVTGSDNTYYFSLDRSADAWPVGQYKIDLYIDGKLVQTVDFEVK
jgi:hypothetical protein